MSNQNNPLDFVTGNSNQSSNTSIAQKLGAIDFKWVAVNPTVEDYQKLVDMKGFRISENYPDYVKTTDYGKYLCIQLFIEESEPTNPEYPIRDNIKFFLYADEQLSMNGNVQTIDGLRNKSYIPLDANGNLNPSQTQAGFLDMNTMVRTRKNGEADLLEFLLIVSGLYSRNNKVRRENNKIMEMYPIALLDDPTLAEPELGTIMSPSVLRPDQATLDILFDENQSSEKQEEAYEMVVGFYRALCDKINSLEVVNTVKIARGMSRGDDGKVYPTLYTSKFGLPGSNTGQYSTASPIVKDIKNRKDYAAKSGKDFPFYFPATLEVEEWSGDESLLGGKPNTSSVKPGINPNRPGTPPRPNIGSMRNPNL